MEDSKKLSAVEVAQQLSEDGLAGIRALVLHVQANGVPRINAVDLQQAIRDENGSPAEAMTELERLGVMWEHRNELKDLARMAANITAPFAGMLDRGNSSSPVVYSFNGDYVREILASVGGKPNGDKQHKGGRSKDPTNKLLDEFILDGRLDWEPQRIADKFNQACAGKTINGHKIQRVNNVKAGKRKSAIRAAKRNVPK